MKFKKYLINFIVNHKISEKFNKLQIQLFII
jgi:hypothetical protein